MFDNDVCGDYSFQEVWDLLENTIKQKSLESGTRLHKENNQ